MNGSFHVGAALTGLVFMVLGVCFLLEAVDAANFRFEIVLPGAVVALGLAIVFGSLFRDRQR